LIGVSEFHYASDSDEYGNESDGYGEEYDDEENSENHENSDASPNHILPAIHASNNAVNPPPPYDQ
jgi:hypothetical protein